MIHLELLSVKGVRSVSRFIYLFFLHVAVQLFQHDVSTVLPLLLCQGSVDSIYEGLFLHPLFCSTDVFVLPPPRPHCFDYFSSIKSRKGG